MRGRGGGLGDSGGEVVTELRLVCYHTLASLAADLEDERDEAVQEDDAMHATGELHDGATLMGCAGLCIGDGGAHHAALVPSSD